MTQSQLTSGGYSVVLLSFSGLCRVPYVLVNSRLSLLMFPMKHTSLALTGVGAAKNMNEEIQNLKISRGHITLRAHDFATIA